MKRLRQVALAFQAGTSDKVYEVDLCEVGINKYVVNFRYGRRGSALRDGTKTPAPVAFAEAEKIYQRLVDSKTGEGYEITSSGTPAAAATTPPKKEEPKAEPEKKKPATGGLSPRDARILATLTAAPPAAGAVASAVRSGLKLVGEAAGATPTGDFDRAIWRAGEVKLRAALPRLLELANLATSGALRDACLAFAISRCAKSGDAAAISALQAIRDRSAKLERSTEEVARRGAAAGRFALEAQWTLGDEATRKKLEHAALGSMPPNLATLAKDGPLDALNRELDAYLAEAKPNPGYNGKTDPTRTVVLEHLYYVDGEHARTALLRALRTVPVAAPFFLRLRHLFKAAEIRRDAETWGLLSHRFEKARSTIGQVWNWNRQQLARTDTNLAFSRGTRTYFRRRTWRLLRRLGKAGDTEYVDMAVGALLPFTDADAHAPRKAQWNPNANYGPWAPYWAFNFLLFGKSTRFAPDMKSGKTFRCTSTWKPGEFPAAREESFPKLWEKSPGGLLQLLDESRCEEVHRFAVKVLEALPKFTDGFDEGVHAMLFRGPYEITAAFALKLVKKAYADKEFPAEVVEAMADCSHAPARTEAFQQIEARRTSYLVKVALMTALVTSRHADTRDFARRLLRTSTMQSDAVKALVAKVLAWLQAAPESESERAADVVETLARCFPRELQTIGLDVVTDLLARPLLPLQMLGAEILLARQAAGQPISGAALQRLIESEHAQVRSLGVKLLGNLGDAFLLEQADLIAALVTHPLADLRESIRPVIVRLSKGNGAFAARMGTALVDTLMRKSLPDGMHEHVLRILRDDLQEFLTALPKETVWKLLRSKIVQAQELGGLLLPSNVRDDELSVREIMLLGSHDILSVREASWKLFDRALPRIKKDLRSAVGMLDAKWADTRKFAADSFRTKFSDDELTPEILVAVCDSILPAVQAVGKELITARFKQEHGTEYLLKLSEHPAESLQLFASAWLEEHASGDPAKLAALEPFLVSVLSRVNKGRVAKARVFAFLAAEGKKSDAAAKIVARVLTRQSVTVAIGDKSAAIEGMLGVADAFPGTDLPIKRVPVEVRR